MSKSFFHSSTPALPCSCLPGSTFIASSWVCVHASLLKRETTLGCLNCAMLAASWRNSHPRWGSSMQPQQELQHCFWHFSKDLCQHFQSGQDQGGTQFFIWNGSNNKWTPCMYEAVIHSEISTHSTSSLGMLMMPYNLIWAYKSSCWWLELSRGSAQHIYPSPCSEEIVNVIHKRTVKRWQ